MKTLITVCAREGSKRLPGKNIREFCGQPLIFRSIVQGINFSDCDVVFTSDSKQYRVMAKEFPIMIHKRPPKLGSDSTDKIDVIRDAVDYAEVIAGYEYSMVLDLAVTSPLREPIDIHSCLSALESGAKAVRTGCYRKFCEYNGEIFSAFQINGAVYGWRRHMLKTSSELTYRQIEMPEVRSFDIDTELDFQIAEVLYEKGLHSYVG